MGLALCWALGNGGDLRGHVAVTQALALAELGVLGCYQGSHQAFGGAVRGGQLSGPSRGGRKKGASVSPTVLLRISGLVPQFQVG